MLIQLVGGVDAVLIELCASKNFELTEQVPYRSGALRIADKDGRTRSITAKAIMCIMMVTNQNLIKINIWASTHCTAVCLWRHVNAALGRNPAT